MKRSAILALLVGIGLAVTLIAANDFGRVLAALATAGWGVLIVIALHLPQTWCSGMGWGALIERRPPLRWTTLYRLRWVRESINTLLPVAQLGGDVARGRLLARRGVAMGPAMATTLIDAMVEMLGQVAFTLAVVALLLGGRHGAKAVPLALAAAIGVGALGAILALAPRLGLARLIERSVARIAGSDTLEGLHDAVLALYRSHARLARAFGFHLAGWVLGGFETFAGLTILGTHANVRAAMIVEGLGQAVRAAGFLIPGALGVQEGGYILIGAIVGVAAPQMLALSLIRRVRELALGLPGLALWHRLEARGTQPPSTAPETA